ncbi:MAG: Npt1/Npt2 family nucleotide transporter [Proteobacteria bacterium]|nr:Npt1/Npt2 family nucleotide transporter [Pseudomonadota bacterium]MDA1298713.1 Npt1/Npt2 family nucleotide transporter [Pseudomonadota bacterium]
MTDVAVNGNVTLSKTEQWLARAGIRPEEKSVTLLLFSNMFMSGIAIGMTRVCALTLFLDQFGSEQLALIAILLGFIGMPLTLIIDRLTRRLSLQIYLFAILGVILGGLFLFRLLLGLTQSSAVVFALPLFFEVAYMLFSLQFIGLLTRLLNVRQTKRLFGLTRSGEFLAEMVGGLLIVLLLRFMAVEDLLLVAILATGAVVVIVQFTVTHFRSEVTITHDANDHAGGAETGMFGMLKQYYVQLITLCYAAYMFAYFFLDVAFYNYAMQQFPNDKDLAAFIAKFFAVAGLLTMFSMIVLFAPILRRFGIMFGLLAFPVVVFAGATAVTVLEAASAGTALIFGVMVITNGARFVLQSSIWKPTVTILFQVLSDRQRSQGTALIEGVVDPVAGAIAGVCLYILSDTLAWEPERFLIVLSCLMIAWIVVSFLIRRQYLTNLMVSIQKRKVGELALSELDNASLDIIKRGIDSPYPAEIFYCLNLLEKIEHPEITEMLKLVMANQNRIVRLDVLKRIADMQITPLTERVRDRIEAETDPGVHGQALITYASLGPDDSIETLLPYLDAYHEDIRRGALVGILRREPRNDIANNYLLGMTRADAPSARIFAAQVLAEIGSQHFSGFLVELLDDLNPDVVEAGVYAAGRIRDDRLISTLVDKLYDSHLQVFASNALRQFGETALFDLDTALTSPIATRRVKLHIIDIIHQIGGDTGIEILLRHIDIEQPELRHQIYVGLASLHYQAAPDDHYLFVNKIDEEVHLITSLLAAIEDLYPDPRYNLLRSALGNELDLRRDNMLLLISFIFPSIVMLDTRAHIDSKVAELRTFALEVLDNLLTGDIKQVVLPLLDDLTVSERLEMLASRFPHQRMSPKARFDNIIETHFDGALYWTRSSLLFLIGQLKADEHEQTVRAGLADKEPIIRETSAWSLSRLSPPDLRRALSTLLADTSPAVREVVRELLPAQP